MKEVENYNVVMANSMTAHHLDVSKTNGVAALMYYAISHIYIEDDIIKPIEFHWKEFTDLIPMTMRACREVVRRATDTSIEFKDPTKDKFVKNPIFSEVRWERGKITLQVNPLLTEYLIGLKDLFTTAKLTHLLAIEGPTMRALFWFITSQHNRCRGLKVPREQMFDLLGFGGTKRQGSYITEEIKRLNQAEIGLLVDYNLKTSELSWKRYKRYEDERVI